MKGILIGLVSESTLLILMICAAGFACRQLALLDVNANPVSQLDDLLLFICIPSFFLYGIFSIVPAIAYSNYMALLVAILQVYYLKYLLENIKSIYFFTWQKVLQVILQTPTIIDGLRRCSLSWQNRARKPGRELITFLVICNLSMWIMETLEIKSYETNRDRIHFYGTSSYLLMTTSRLRNKQTAWKRNSHCHLVFTWLGHPLWTLLSHLTLPLTLFYRFHSASCLVDIWKSAYEAPDH